MAYFRGEGLLIDVDELVLLHNGLAFDQQQLQRRLRPQHERRHGVPYVDVRERVESLQGNVGELAYLE